MPQTQTLFQVFVASPSDLAEEQKILGEVIDNINRTESDAHNIILKLLKWETDSYPGFRKYSQDVINQQIGNDYDIFLGIMWGRFGSPTPRAGSGTEEGVRSRVFPMGKISREYRDHVLFQGCWHST